jgi:hypothetical protein
VTECLLTYQDTWAVSDQGRDRFPPASDLAEVPIDPWWVLSVAATGTDHRDSLERFLQRSNLEEAALRCFGCSPKREGNITIL